MVDSQTSSGTVVVHGLEEYAMSPTSGGPYVYSSSPVALETQGSSPWRPAPNWPGFRSLIPKVIGVKITGGFHR